MLPTAANWILYAGVALKTNAIDYPHADAMGSKRLPWSVGGLQQGLKDFNERRWGVLAAAFRFDEEWRGSEIGYSGVCQESL